MTAREATDDLHLNLANLMQALAVYVDHAEQSDGQAILKIAKHLTDAEQLLSGLGLKQRLARTRIPTKP